MMNNMENRTESKIAENTSNDKTIIVARTKNSNAKRKKKIMNSEDIKLYLGVNLNDLTARVHVTPIQAKFILNHCNKANRRIKMQHVETLKRDMEAGNWYNDIDYIGFNKNGVLINGQHRLKALSLANVKSILLKFDFDVDQHISMDTGAARSYTDQVTISKKSSVAENSIEALPNKYRYIINAGLKINDSKINLSNTELSEIWTVYKKDLEFCEKHDIFNVGNKAGTTVKSSIFWAYLSGVDIHMLENFAKVLRSGITRTENDIPIIRLRDALVDLRGNSKALDIKRAEYTQQCIFSVLAGSTSNRLPANPIMHYQNYDFWKRIKDHDTKSTNERLQEELFRENAGVEA